MTLKPQKKLRQNKSNTFITDNILLIIGGMVLIGIVIGMSLNTASNPPKHSAAAKYTSYASSTLSVAKDFACSCGTCGEKNLAVCTCDVALDTKNFIQGNLQNGMPQQEIVALVNDIYGHYVGDNQLKIL